MQKIKTYMLVLLMVCSFISSCVTKKKISDDDFALEDEPTTSSNLSLDSNSNATIENSSNNSSNNDEFSEFADSANSASENNLANKVSSQEKPQESPLAKTTGDELTLDDEPPKTDETNELSLTDNSQPVPVQNTDQTPPPPVLDLTEAKNTNPVDDSLKNNQSLAPDSIVKDDQNKAQANNAKNENNINPNEEVSKTLSPQMNIAQVNDLKFLANENGGTFVISSNQAMSFKTRLNAANNQLVLEIQDTIVPDRLKRPFNMKDMSSTIGGVDIYQSRGSKIARFVIQLRANSPEPTVQPEGNSILIVGAPNPAFAKNSAESAADVSKNGVSLDRTHEATDDGLGILGSASLDDFLASNNKYYGRKINFEVNGMDIRDAISFIAEESGINLIVDNGITNSPITMKLRNVPWDQVLVTILRSNQLAYRRQGDVIRIGSQKNLIEEENEAIRFKQSREESEPLVIKNFLVNYADVGELENKVRDFISQSSSKSSNSGSNKNALIGSALNTQSMTGSSSSEVRGRVTSDKRTNILIVTETASRLKEVEKLINLLDRQPQQVLIEARVVEATESYGKAVGVNFCTNGYDGNGCGIPKSTRLNSAVNGVGVNGQTLTASPAMQFSPNKGGSFGASLWLGTLGSFGDISTSLSLDETDNKIKILSSPRLYLIHGSRGTIKQTTSIQQPKLKLDGVVTVSTATTFEPVPVGLTLEVEPIISSIGTVRLKLNLSRGAIGQNNTTTDRSISNEVIVRSGDTAVVGGVYTSDVTEQNTGIPGLRSIPILGWLFSSESISKLKTELMFFVSPQILNDLNTTTQAGAEQQAARF